MLLEELSTTIGMKTRFGAIDQREDSQSAKPAGDEQHVARDHDDGGHRVSRACHRGDHGATRGYGLHRPVGADPGDARIVELQVTPEAEPPGFFCSLRYATVSLVFWPGESATRERSSPSVAATICTVQERGANPRAENDSVVVPSCLAVSRPLARLRVAIEVSPSTQSIGTSGMMVESAASARTLNSRLARRDSHGVRQFRTGEESSNRGINIDREPALLTKSSHDDLGLSGCHTLRHALGRNLDYGEIGGGPLQVAVHQVTARAAWVRPCSA